LPEDDLLLTFGVDTDGDTIPDEFALLDVNMDGIEDLGDLFLTPDELCEWVDGPAARGPRDGTDLIMRDVAATYLNGLNGNDLGDPTDPNDPAYWLQQGIDFILAYEGGPKERPNGDAWKIGTSDDGIESGADIHNQLAMYNESGEMTTLSGDIVTLAFDGDNWDTIIAQNWLETHGGTETAII
jgi:hypothetical protein